MHVSIIMHGCESVCVCNVIIYYTRVLVNVCMGVYWCVRIFFFRVSACIPVYCESEYIYYVGMIVCCSDC